MTRTSLRSWQPSLSTSGPWLRCGEARTFRSLQRRVAVLAFLTVVAVAASDYRALPAAALAFGLALHSLRALDAEGLALRREPDGAWAFRDGRGREGKCECRVRGNLRSFLWLELRTLGQAGAGVASRQPCLTFLLSGDGLDPGDWRRLRRILRIEAHASGA